MSKNEIALGKTVKDTVTGFQGIVASKLEMITGNVMWSIQPKPKKDVGTTYPEAMTLDAHSLKVVDAGISVSLPPVDEVGLTKFQLGETLQDIPSGLEGTAVERVTFSNGCVYYGIAGSVTKEGQLPLKLIPHMRLKKIGAGMVKAAAAVAPSVTAPRPPGGPVIRGSLHDR